MDEDEKERLRKKIDHKKDIRGLFLCLLALFVLCWLFV